MGKTGMGEAHYLHLRLFVEGIEVPVIGASVTSGLNMPATASIQVVPSDRLSVLLPRTVVHLFYLDSAEFAGSERDVPDDHHYKLFFCGEVFDISFGKSGHGSRSVTFRCLDFSNVWDTNFSYIMRYAVGAQEGPEGGAFVRNTSAFLGAGGEDGSATQNPFDDIVSDPAVVIRQMAESSGPGNPALPGRGSLLGGLLAVLELLSGIQGFCLGINPWATVEERRCRVMDSIVSDDGTTAKNLFDQQVFADWLQQRTGSAGSVISFRQIISMISGYIYYDVVTNVTPAYVRGDDGKGRPGRQPLKFSVDGVELRGVATAEPESPEGISYATEAEPSSYSLIEELRSLPRVLPFSEDKLLGLDSEFLAYVVDVIKKLHELTEGDTYQYGQAAGEPINIFIISGYRNIETQNEIRRSRGQAPETESTSSSAHVRGFAVDLNPIFSGRQQIGSAPYYLSGDSVFGQPIPKSFPNSTSVVRFRKALWILYERSGQTTEEPIFDSFDELVEEIRSDGSLEALCFPELGSLDVHADSLRNHAQFFLRFREAVREVNKTSSIQGQYGGDWYGTADPLWNLLGLGNDPVHVQDGDFRSKTAQRVGGLLVSDLVAVQTATQNRERLKSFIFRPNIWFSPPPMCNVVYPHMYESLTVSRQMMRETTRLQLDAFNQFFESNIVNTYYWAPQFPDGNHLIGAGLGSITKTVIMDHEVFSGIIPRMERISEISFYAKQSGQGQELRSSSADWESSEVASSSAAATLSSYGNKVAHFNLLTNRYSSRTGGFDGPFNPNLVCGFPAAIIDYVPSADPQEVSLITGGTRPSSQGGQKVNWLGMISGLTHTFDQGGARTRAEMTYLRSHRVGDQTDDLLSESVTDQAYFVVQDPLYEQEAPNSDSRVDFSGYFSFSADEAAGVRTSSSLARWALKALAVTTGKRSIHDLARLASIVSANPQDQAALYGSADFAGSMGSADFSDATEAVARLVGTYGPDGSTITSASWEGAPLWVVVRFTVAEPTQDTQDFYGFPGSGLGDLREISIARLAATRKLASVASAIEETAKLVSFLYPEPSPSPIRSNVYRDLDVAVRLPGSVLKLSVEGAKSAGRRVPIEEAIRPPWIDKDIYTARESSTPGYSEICRLYMELFHCPSVIRELLQAGATPYDNMSIHSVEQAVDFLVTRAGAQLGSDFLTSYTNGVTRRPIATLPDILAPKGYLRDERGRWSPTALNYSSEADLAVTGGFHSNAVTGSSFARSRSESILSGNPGVLRFGYNLEFLDIKNVTLRSRLDPLTEGVIDEVTAGRLDPRADRAKRVNSYLRDISGSTSLRRVNFGSNIFTLTPSGKGKKG